jgi:outer membrane protein OmpA-like peptidoglycan-associated protein
VTRPWPAGWLVLLLAACSPASENQAAPTNSAAASTPAATAERQQPGRALGTTSSLSAQTSPLTGQITDFEVTMTETATVVTLAADTLFEFDKADLTPAAQANLQRTADAVRKGGSGPIAISGHTDAKGEDAYNLTLSARRAEAVAAWLKQQPGLSGREFAIEGKGETAPVALNAKPDGSDDPEGRARNRRVVVSIPR